MLPFYEKVSENIRAYYASNLQFPLHLHSALELIYVESGSLSMTIDGKNYPLGAGDFALVFPNLTHSYQVLPDTENLSLLGICDPGLLPDFSQIFSRLIPECPILTAKQLHPDVLYALRALALEYRSAQDPIVSKACFQLLLGRILPLLTLKSINPEARPDLTYRLVQYISEHFKEPLSLSLVAEQLSVSKYHLSRIFSQKLHMSFNEYLNQLRADHAVTLIRTTDHTFTYISLEAGFENQRTFNRVFRQIYGKTPSDFRR